LLGEVGVQTQEAAKTAMGSASAGVSGLKGYGLTALLGIVVGIFSGLFGVGGGIIMVPFLVVAAGYPQQMAQGISLAAMIPTALSGAYQYYKGGNLLLPVSLALAVGAIPGAYVGSNVAQHLNKTTLGALFALFMMVMAVRIMPAGGAKSLGLSGGLLGSMALLVGMLLVGIGVRLVFAR
jgi:uncharacterized membrane protein YfcA